jgi:hypothetical protein
MKKQNNSMEETVSKLKGFAMLFLCLMVSLSFASATLDGYGSKKVNQPFIFCQVCSDATYITLTSIETPTTTIQINENMSMTGTGQYCYNYTPSEIGRYDFRGISDGCEKSFATYMEVTPSGFGGTSTFYFIMIILIGALIFMGFNIKEEWFVVMGGMGLIMLGIYSINYGIAGFKDMFMTWGLGLFEIGVGATLSIGAAWQKFSDD